MEITAGATLGGAAIAVVILREVFGFIRSQRSDGNGCTVGKLKEKVDIQAEKIAENALKHAAFASKVGTQIEQIGKDIGEIKRYLFDGKRRGGEDDV